VRTGGWTRATAFALAIATAMQGCVGTTIRPGQVLKTEGATLEGFKAIGLSCLELDWAESAGEKARLDGRIERSICPVYFTRKVYYEKVVTERDTWLLVAAEYIILAVFITIYVYLAARGGGNSFGGFSTGDRRTRTYVVPNETLVEEDVRFEAVAEAERCGIEGALVVLDTVLCGAGKSSDGPSALARTDSQGASAFDLTEAGPLRSAGLFGSRATRSPGWLAAWSWNS
jgi:hypothetical protein